jgi:transposase
MNNRELFQAAVGLSDPWGDVCCDLSLPFVAGVKAHLPDAAITFDR